MLSGEIFNRNTNKAVRVCLPEESERMWNMRMKPISRMTRISRQTSRVWTRLFMLVIAIFVASPWATAQDSVHDYMKPRINRDQFAVYCGQLRIDKNQRGIIDLLYEDYAAELNDFADKIDNRSKLAGRTRLESAFSGRISMGGSELRALRAKLLGIYRECGPAADEMLQSLLAGIEGFLNEDQKQRLPAAQRELRRKIMLHPRQAGSRMPNYAGEGVDVLQLVEKASTETGGELLGIEDEAIDEILARYELDLDAILRRTFADERSSRLEYSIEKLNKNVEVIARIQKQLTEHWNSLFELNRITVKTIGEIIERHSGTSTRNLWEDRFHREAFEWLYIQTMPDRQIDWIRSNELDPELVKKAEIMYDSYCAGRDGLQREAISLMVRARQERGVSLHPMSLPAEVQENAGDLHKDLLRNSGSKKNHDTRFAGEFESLLSADQRRSMRRALSWTYRGQ